MKEKINNELQKLQQELAKLDSAVAQIEKAGKISEDVIQAIKGLHEEYKKSFDKLSGLYENYLQKTYETTEKSLSNVFEDIKKRIEKEEQVLEKYVELSVKTDELTQEYLKRIVQDNRKIIDELSKEALKSLDNQKDVYAKQLAQNEKQLQSVVSKHSDQTEKMNEVLANYLELAQSTARLSENIKKIDFPQRFDAMNSIMQSLNKKHEKITEQINQFIENSRENEIYELILKQNKKIKRQNVWLFILLLVSIGSFAFTILSMLKLNALPESITNILQF